MNSRQHWEAIYWLGLPLRWLYQVIHNGHGILRVLDIVKFRPMGAGLVSPDHPWVTGINPATGKVIWHENVVYRSPRDPNLSNTPDDETIINKTGQFLADRVRTSTVLPELPVGPQRRMPHGINYIHGTSHYNSGIFIFNDLADGFRHVTDPKFRQELARFVRHEKREILFIFRDRDYTPREFAYFACCLRTLFPWFCNANGPRGRVLWGNAAPYATANLITGYWVKDVYDLKSLEGRQRVIRPAIQRDRYFQHGEYARGRGEACWPEKLLAWVTYFRVRARGAKGGMFFVDRRKVYADHIAHRQKIGVTDEPITPL